jgi:hypothetical protein
MPGPVLSAPERPARRRGAPRCTSTSTWSPRAATPGSGTRVSPRTCARAARAVRTSRRCWPWSVTPGADWQARGSLAGRGVLAQVPDQADDILGDEPADGAAGVHADDDPAAGFEHEPGRLQVPRVGLTKAPVLAATAPALWPTGNCRPCLAIRFWVAASSSADSATTETPRAARPSWERWNALSCALQYGHHDPR